MDICQDTYADAIETSIERCDREITAICDYLRAHPLMGDADIKTLGREMRAWRYARNHIRSRAVGLAA